MRYVNGMVGEDLTTLDGTFEFFLGPAASGAHPHQHSSAWNGKFLTYILSKIGVASS